MFCLVFALFWLFTSSLVLVTALKLAAFTAEVTSLKHFRFSVYLKVN